MRLSLTSGSSQCLKKDPCFGKPLSPIWDIHRGCKSTYPISQLQFYLTTLTFYLIWCHGKFVISCTYSEWILTKVVNGERASYSAPKFARMQERTRSQMLEDIVANLANHAETGQIPKPYRRGSWRPIGKLAIILFFSQLCKCDGNELIIDTNLLCDLICCWIGHMRPSSPLLDSVRDQFEDYDQLAKDFTRVFLNLEPSCLQNAQLFDVVFLVGQSKQKARFIGVRAILGVRSRVFQVNWHNPLIIHSVIYSFEKRCVRDLCMHNSSTMN